MRRLCLLLLLASLLPASIVSTATAFAQTKPPNPYYSRLNTYGFFTAYSNDSSHILLGIVEQRRLLEFGVSYSRRLWQGRVVNWQYNAELLPVALESDPLVTQVETLTSPFPGTFTNTYAPIGACHKDSGSYSQTVDGVTYSYTYVNTCSRQWTIGEGMSPVGLQWNFRPRRKVQPFLIGHGGYMYSTRAIPIEGAGNFNFTFDFGAGLEFYRSKTRSIRAEYRYHHISNHDTASQNPGIDNGLFQVTYAFGR
jgi:opacity protein-like surface antigen